jgi:phosphonate C-P lyase system protein PhnH
MSPLVSFETDSYESTAATLAAARLDGDDSLAVFRVLLDTAARPGLPATLRADLVAVLPAPLLAVLALIDLDHRFAVLGNDDDAAHGRWTPLISAATDAQPTAELVDADVVIARRSPTPEEIGALRTGTAETPELGARLFVACATVAAGSVSDVVRNGNAEAGSSRFAVAGPGASTPRWVEVAGVSNEVVVAIAQANRSFPAGIDVWFLDDVGNVVGVPRSSQILLDPASGHQHDVMHNEAMLSDGLLRDGGN